MDPDDRAFLATLILAGSIGIFVLARPWVGELAAPLAWLVLGLATLAIIGGSLIGTRAGWALRRWLNAPPKKDRRSGRNG